MAISHKSWLKRWIMHNKPNNYWIKRSFYQGAAEGRQVRSVKREIKLAKFKCKGQVEGEFRGSNSYAVFRGIKSMLGMQNKKRNVKGFDTSDSELVLWVPRQGVATVYKSFSLKAFTHRGCLF